MTLTSFFARYFCVDEYELGQGQDEYLWIITAFSISKADNSSERAIN